MKLPPILKKFPYPVLAAGLLGLILRIWLFASGVDEKGLLSNSHPADALIFILTAAVLVMICLFLRSNPEIAVYKQSAKPSIPAAAGCGAAALGILVTGIRELVRVSDRVTILAFILGLIAIASLVFLGLCRFRGTNPNMVFHGCICAYLMVHVISQYRVWSAETQLQGYVFQVLASVFLMLSTYYKAALDVRSGNRKVYLFFHYSAMFFCCLALCSNQWPFYLSMGIWCVTADFSQETQKPNTLMYLPKNVHYCLNTLENAGYSAYAVGGCVRDALMGLVPHDYDLCTSATPDQICRLFSQHPLVRSGEQHGTIGVVLDTEVYEITTFRTEGDYADNRHPDWVEFVVDVEDDLARRDFTINAMAYSPTQGLVDPWGGQEDLTNGILRTVGDPEARFHEDALRILRGVRFATRFKLTCEEQTEKAMLELVHLTRYLAPERVFSELCKMIVHVTAEDLLHYAPIITQIIPELAPTVDFDQCSLHHAYDVYTHTAYTVGATPENTTLRLAALLHDIGKPKVFTLDENHRGHFYEHAKVGAEMADEILKRFRASNALRNEVVFLIEHHMTPFEADKKQLRRRLGKYGEDAVAALLELQKADYTSKGVEEEEEVCFDDVEALLKQIRQEGACLTVKDLAITGNDLLDLGVQPGKIIGHCMTFLLNLVQDELILNTREDLLSAAKQFFENHQEEIL